METTCHKELSYFQVFNHIFKKWKQFFRYYTCLVESKRKAISYESQLIRHMAGAGSLFIPWGVWVAKQSQAAKQAKAKQAQAERSKPKQSEAKQSDQKQSEAKQSKAPRSKAKQSKTQRSEAKQGEAKRSTGQQSKTKRKGKDNTKSKGKGKGKG